MTDSLQIGKTSKDLMLRIAHCPVFYGKEKGVLVNGCQNIIDYQRKFLQEHNSNPKSKSG